MTKITALIVFLFTCVFVSAPLYAGNVPVKCPEAQEIIKNGLGAAHAGDNVYFALNTVSYYETADSWLFKRQRWVFAIAVPESKSESEALRKARAALPSLSLTSSQPESKSENDGNYFCYYDANGLKGIATTFENWGSHFFDLFGK